MMIAQFKSEADSVMDKLSADSQKLLLTCAEERHNLCVISKAMAILAETSYRSNFIFSASADECLDIQLALLLDAATIATAVELPEIAEAIRAVATERYDL